MGRRRQLAAANVANLAISLSLEANEVLELFQWSEHCAKPDELPGELADVALYLLQLASVSGIDLEQAILDKWQNKFPPTGSE